MPLQIRPQPFCFTYFWFITHITRLTFSVAGLDNHRLLTEIESFFIHLFIPHNRILISLVPPSLILLELGTLSLRVNQMGYEGDHSPQCSTVVRTCKGIYLHSPTCVYGVMFEHAQEELPTHFI